MLISLSLSQSHAECVDMLNKVVNGCISNCFIIVPLWQWNEINVFKGVGRKYSAFAVHQRWLHIRVCQSTTYQQRAVQEYAIIGTFWVMTEVAVWFSKRYTVL
jgi:hypothetical protein